MEKYKYTKEYINDLEILKNKVELTAKGLVKLDELKELIQIAKKYETIQASENTSKLLLADVIKPICTHKDYGKCSRLLKNKCADCNENPDNQNVL